VLCDAVETSFLAKEFVEDRFCRQLFDECRGEEEIRKE
jgi:hypothetical protein